MGWKIPLHNLKNKQTKIHIIWNQLKTVKWSLSTRHISNIPTTPQHINFLPLIAKYNKTDKNLKYPDASKKCGNVAKICHAILSVTLPTFSNSNAPLVRWMNSSIALIYQELWSSHWLAHCDVTKCTDTFPRLAVAPLAGWGSKYESSSGACFPTVGTVCSRRETVPLFRLSPNHLDKQAAGRRGGGGWGDSLGFKLRLKAHSVHYGDRGR